MSRKNQSAFPELQETEVYDSNLDTMIKKLQSFGGLTKFEYFTAMAMQGLLAHGHIADIELRAVACAKKVLSEIQKNEFNEG